jgi:hypothetical protein
MARREERAYSPYVADEQRRQRRVHPIARPAEARTCCPRWRPFVKSVAHSHLMPVERSVQQPLGRRRLNWVAHPRVPVGRQRRRDRYKMAIL